MLIIDLNQIAISNIMAQIGNHTNMKLDEDIVRHMILNKIRLIRQKFKKEEYGELVVACDGKNNWRRQFFPQYKANRRADRQVSEFDWGAVYDILNKIRDELKDNFPYIVIHIDGAEADDIIATLVIERGVDINTDMSEQVVIVSGDKDFVQLQKFANVKQYDPIRNKFIVENNPIDFIKRHIIKGDHGDGIPNILSDDDSFVAGVRQKKVTEKFIINFNYDDQTDQIKRNYMRNAKLIDLANVPDNIRRQTFDIFGVQEKTMSFRRQKTFNYFVSKKLKNLMEHVGEF